MVGGMRKDLLSRCILWILQDLLLFGPLFAGISGNFINRDNKETGVELIIQISKCFSVFPSWLFFHRFLCIYVLLLFFFLAKYFCHLVILVVNYCLYAARIRSLLSLSKDLNLWTLVVEGVFYLRFVSFNLESLYFYIPSSLHILWCSANLKHLPSCINHEDEKLHCDSKNTATWKEL